MAKESKIEWTDATWNPWYGCHKVSAGCRNCYMERWAKRTGKNPDQVIRSKSTFNDPLKWKEFKRIFVCSLSDFFIEEADEWRQEALDIIRKCPQHTFIIPTKRTDGLFNCLVRNSGESPVSYPNVWILASVENQEMADKRTNELLKIREYGDWPVLGISAEPLLEEIDISDYLLDWSALDIALTGQDGEDLRHCQRCGGDGFVEYFDASDTWGEDCPSEENHTVPCPDCGGSGIDPWYYKRQKDFQLLNWLIIGAESGPNRRECKIEDVRHLVRQGKDAGVPVFVKQLHINGKLSRDMNEWPEDLRIREFPEVKC